jgi:hypothetical protein
MPPILACKDNRHSNTKLNELYKQVKMLRKNNKPSSNYLPILKKLYDEHPDDWLLCAEIYEEIYSDPTLIGEKKLLKDHINLLIDLKHKVTSRQGVHHIIFLI